MITAIYSFYMIGTIHGLEPWIGFWLFVIATGFSIFFVFSKNRTKEGRKRLIVAFAAAEALFDICSLFYFSAHPVFFTYGVGFTYGLFFWCGITLLLGAVASVLNYQKGKQDMQ